MNKRYYWLRLKDDFFQDKKIKKLRQLAGGDTYTIIYLKLQLLSLKDNGNLYFDNIEDTFIEELALEIDESVEDVKVCVMYLIKCGLIEEISASEYSLVETKKCIGSETASTIRSRKCREKQKLLQGNINATICNGEKENREEIENKEKIDIINYYNNNIHNITGIELEKIEEWGKIFTDDVIKESIDIAVMNNARNMAYINGTLRNWKEKGYNTLNDIKNNENRIEENESVELFDYDWLGDDKDEIMD